MSTDSFETFFRTATGRDSDPFDYQLRLACGDEGQGRDCSSLLIDVPTGCGKTAAVVLAWVWNRVVLSRDGWPRRLVYCLPMRSLVEQTRRETRTWLLRLARKNTKPRDGSALRRLALHSPHVLMGGAEKTDWDLHPGRDAILVGTQDMLLSRALNHGYGMSRYRWPMHFGLLNSDCLWVFDETQLLDVGVETSAQLDAFRQASNLGAPTRAFTWWMSATLSSTQLATVDHPEPPGGWPKLELRDRDKAPGSPVQNRRTAAKRLGKAAFTLVPGDKGEYAKKLAGFISESHRRGTLTLVVLNRVARAREVYQALQKLRVPPAENLALVHSRFRPGDRQRHEKILFSNDTDRIVVATEAVEAGVDVSARVLITELAPWPSLVQRFGRCNRYGEWPEGADVFWIDVRPKDDKDELRLPYAPGELETARELLAPLTEASITTLNEVTYETKPVVRSVLRRKDLLDLFDTTADLLGHDLDVSRYVRDSEDTDVQVFWRDVPADDKLPPDEPDAARHELCRVSLADMTRFLKKKPRVFVWNTLDAGWLRAGEWPRPGQTYLVAREAGGYDDLLGWTGEHPAKGRFPTLLTPALGLTPPGYGGNKPSFIKQWVLLNDHTTHVREMLAVVLRDTLPLTDAETAALQDAALWHDVGKAHEVFQKLLHDAVIATDPAEACPDENALWAKSAGTGLFVPPRRRGFRHELASALAWLQAAPARPAHLDLTAFLIAAHHGRVRLSIRALPDETLPPADPVHSDRLCARGVWDGDLLPAEALPEAARTGLPEQGPELDLGYMRMGHDEQRGPSWLARMLALRDEPPAAPALGPFRLAYLETLLRAADMRASAQEARRP